MSVAPHRSIEKDTYTPYYAYARIKGLTDSGVAATDISQHLVSDYKKLTEEDSIIISKLRYDNTILVSISSCDSELGIIQPLDEISKIIKNFATKYTTT